MAITSIQAGMVYDFYAITSYTNEGYQSVVTQMSMEVVSYDSTTASLLFWNTGVTPCAIEQIFFAYDTDAYSLGATAPTDWNFGTPPPDLPGGDGFFMADFYLEANPPPAKNGILLNENLAVTLNYGAGFDILEALNTGDLQVGLHTISIIDTTGRLITYQDLIDYPEMDFTEEDIIDGKVWNYSESSINNIPEPASMVLILASTAGIGFIRRKFMS
jgi:hypothetical protein